MTAQTVPIPRRPLNPTLDPTEPFGDVTVRNQAERLALPEGYFDAMDTETLQWAVAFDGLPAPIRAKWAELVAMHGGMTAWTESKAGTTTAKPGRR